MKRPVIEKKAKKKTWIVSVIKKNNEVLVLNKV